MKLTQLSNLNTKYELKDSIFPALLAGEETTIIYIPEIPNSGKNFINKYRKRGVFNEVLLLPNSQLLNKKSINAQYIKDFKKLNPNVKIVPKFKNFVKGRANIIDMTPYMELYYILGLSLSKFKVTFELFKIINQLIKENDIDNAYIFLDTNNENHLFLDTLYKIFRKGGFKIKTELLNVDSIFGLIQNDSIYDVFNLANKKEDELLFKPNLFNLLLKELNIEEQETKTDEEIKKEVKENIKNISEKILSDKKIKTLKTEIKNGEMKVNLESSIDEIYQEISKINFQEDLKNKSIEEKLNYLFQNEKDTKLKNKIKEVIDYLSEINKEYNGSIKLNKDLIKKSSNSYYNPLDIIGFDDISVYDKQRTAFGESLDKSMFDLFKTIEEDKDAGIKILNIDVDIEDTNKSRFKIYKLKLKNTKFGSKNIYELPIKVPYPIKGKYLKMDGVNYIMINQFFPKPLLKIQPNLVRLYTQFSTFSVTLNSHKFNGNDDLDHVLDEVIKLNKAKVDFVDDFDKLDKISEKFNFNLEMNLINKKIEF